MPYFASKEGNINHDISYTDNGNCPRFSELLHASVVVDVSSRDSSKESLSKELPVAVTSIERWAVGGGRANTIADG